METATRERKVTKYPESTLDRRLSTKV